MQHSLATERGIELAEILCLLRSERPPVGLLGDADDGVNLQRLGVDEPLAEGCGPGGDGLPHRRE